MLSSVTASPDPANNVQYFWDLINPVARFILLNQTLISSLSFNIAESLASNNSCLNWSLLPSNVQQSLLAQKASELLSLSYQQWGWVDSSNSFANTTLLSLLSASFQSSLSNLYILLAPLVYDSQVDLTDLNKTISENAVLNQKKSKLAKGNAVKDFFDEFFKFFKGLLPANGRFRRGKFVSSSKKPTAQSIYTDAVKRAENYVKSVGIKC